MIFEPTKNINKEKKPFFLEKIGIYCRLVSLYAQENQLLIPQEEDIFNVSDELKKIGVIENLEEIPTLKKILGSELFSSFISCVACYVKNSEQLEPIVYKLRNESRRRLQLEYQSKNLPNVADFFCGAGGLSLGFCKAGFRIVFANDFQKVCTETYSYNHPEVPSSKIYTGDIKSIIGNLNEFINDEVDMVIGGPPCQSFSTANQRRVIDDPRNVLYKYFIEAVGTLCPKIVLMENVRGMLKVADQVIEDYKGISIHKNGISYHYIASYRLLNSVNFGVAQSRERLIYLAVRNDIAWEKNISPEKLFEQIEESYVDNQHYSLSSALEYIKPLEAPRIKGQTETNDEKTGMKIGINTYNSCGNAYLEKINDGRQLPFVFNHKARYCSDVNYEIFRRLCQGEDSTNPKIADIMPYSRRNGIFKDKYYKLIANKPCRTITAHLQMDCLSHIHPFQVRSITPREAARIQSFPDDYLFLGRYLKTYMEIGNAVPVLMAEQIAKILKKYL